MKLTEDYQSFLFQHVKISQQPEKLLMGYVLLNIISLSNTIQENINYIILLRFIKINFFFITY